MERIFNAVHNYDTDITISSKRAIKKKTPFHQERCFHKTENLKK